MLSALQRAGRWCFMRVEALFNLAFGERLNPLYYLGALSTWMLWIVVGSGLYLYVFFDTGINEAYASVERLTNGQRYLGGILRSLHRYASDGMVLTMLLHLTRHFVFDRYRGFRWFSWLSGVTLLWMVYVAGINGYMLPADRLAQFVTIASAEWLDWLPVFQGLLVRNFIFAENFSDRLFSLLSFIHIGVPLAVIALLWIHVQRVPQAKTTPPRPILLMLSAALIALSLVKPAVSQAPADLSKAVTEIAFDWFYLPAFALLYRSSPAELWQLLGGATLLFVLLPWLPPQRTRGAALGLHVLVHPDNRFIVAREGETVLDAALREGIAMPFDCRNGGCGECKGRILHGDIDRGAFQESALTASERAQGVALMCCATPRSDLEIEYTPKEVPRAVPPRLHFARVVKLELLTPDVMRVLLSPSGEALRYYPGQYINVLLESGEKRAFSFATAPHAGGPIELQIRRVAGGKYTTHVFEHMKIGEEVRFEGPLGTFFLREDSEKPMIFVAGATGFAPVKSMLEHAFHRGVRRRIYLYWGTRRPEDLYLKPLAEQWARAHDNFTFVPVVSEPRPEDGWNGRIGLVHAAILQDFPDLSGHQVYACGSVAMVEAATPAFREQGMSQDDCFSDAFRLAPHIQGESAEMAKLGGGAR
jgi:NAD(P)H-flavin reductase/quinol-cytochrome oxidoreductase complex cytochrome b subunit